MQLPIIVEQFSPQLLKLSCNAMPAEALYWGNAGLHKAFCCLCCLLLLLDCRRVYWIQLSIVVEWLHTQLWDTLCNPVPAEPLHWSNNDVCKAIGCPYCLRRM